jgi:uncharacterized membrane protein (DUF485 family)
MPGARISGATWNARLGMVLFCIYLIFYGGFVLLNAFAPGMIARPFLVGINLAVNYGIGLILAAFVMALLYLALSRKDITEKPREDRQ